MLKNKEFLGKISNKQQNYIGLNMSVKFLNKNNYKNKLFYFLIQPSTIPLTYNLKF